MSMINTFNSNISDFINKENETYTSWIGRQDFVPETTIVQSEDFNCGAVCNELEFGRAITSYFVKSLDVSQAGHTELNRIITSLVNLPRRGTVESDASYLTRYKFLVVNKTFPRRLTRQSIINSIRYYLSDEALSIQVIEKFDMFNLYFQLRVESVINTNEAFTLDNTPYGFLDQAYLVGPSFGGVGTYLSSLITRFKAAGVDFDILFINQHRHTLSSNAFVGIIQMYKTVNARIKAKASITKSSNATIV